MFENGLQYVRSDFHLHTNKDKEFTYTGEQNSFVNDYVSALKEANISVGVITNHSISNSVVAVLSPNFACNSNSLKFILIHLLP